jgi:hypothetical protein
MKKIACFLIAFLLVIFLGQSWAATGTTTTHGFFYKPPLAARGEVEKNNFEAGLNRVDARLGKEIWVGDPNYGTTFQSAVTAIGSNAVILRVPAGTYNISADLTVSANITLKPERGAVFAVATGKTLTINGGLEAGLYQIFSCSGTGKVVFGPGSVTEAYPEWGGAVADGTTDSATGINLIAAACKPYGIPFKLSAGVYKTTKSLDFTNGNPTLYYSGWKISGAGEYVTTILGNLTEAYAVCDFTGNEMPQISGLYIDTYAGGASQATCGLLLAREHGTGRGNQARLNNVAIYGGTKAAVVMSSFDLANFQSCFFGGMDAPALYCSVSDELAVGSKFQTLSSAGLGDGLGNTNQTFINCILQAQRADAGGVAVFNTTGSFTMYNCFGVPGKYATSFVELAGNGATAFMYNCRTEYLGDIMGDTSVLEQGASCTANTIGGHISGNYGAHGTGPLIKLKSGLQMNNYYINIVPIFGTGPLIGGGGIICNNIIYNPTNKSGDVATGSYGNTIYQSSETPWANLFGGVNGNRIVTSQSDMFNCLAIGNGGITIKRHLQGAAWWDPGTVADGTIVSTTISVPGASVVQGDPVTVGMGYVPAGVLLSATVSAADTVTVTLLNKKGSNYAPGTVLVRVGVWQY